MPIVTLEILLQNQIHNVNASLAGVTCYGSAVSQGFAGDLEQRLCWTASSCQSMGQEGKKHIPHGNFFPPFDNTDCFVLDLMVIPSDCFAVAPQMSTTDGRQLSAMFLHVSEASILGSASAGSDDRLSSTELDSDLDSLVKI